MPEIAPWENPNLPAPVATIERQIEGRSRRFALWQWDNRLVWQDVNHPRLWWATLDVATTLDDLERAIEQWKFGRAFSESCCFSGRGEIVGFDRSVSFSSDYRFSHDFYILVDAEGGGIARWKQSGNWARFGFNSYKRLKRLRRRIYAKRKFQSPLAIPIWRFDFQPPKLGNALLENFQDTFIQPLSPELKSLFERGEGAELFRAVKDLVTWRFHLVTISRYQIYDFVDGINRQHRNVTSKICEYFGLPIDLNFSLAISRNPNFVTLVCYGLVKNTIWSIHSRLSEVSTAHEILELQLRLRDALRPILTPTEIEEILTPPARL